MYFTLKSKKSIKIRTAYIIIIILTLSFGFSTLFNTFHVRSMLNESIINEVTASGIIIRRTINNSLKYFPLDNFIGMEAFLQNVVNSNKKLKYCFVSWKNGIVLYHSIAGFSGIRLSDKYYASSLFTNYQTSLRIDKFIETIIPILSNNMVVGYIHLGVEQRVIDSKIYSMLLLTGLIFLVTLIFSIIFLMFFISRKVINPITDLSTQMKKIADNMELDKELIIKGDDEINELGKAFSVMINEINHYSSNLEILVNERTQELNRVNQELAANTRKIDREMKMASLLQSSILPAEFPVNNDIEIAAYYTSMDQIGGDYYDIFPLDENKYGIVIADVSGHGVPAALVTMMAKVAFTTFSKQITSSDIILEKVNQELVKVLGIEVMHYLTAFFIIIDTSQNYIQFSNAGHPSQLVYSSETKECIYLKTYGRFIGLHSDTIFGRKEMLLKSGDKILLFTDGIIEAKDPEGALYRHERLCEFTKKNSELKAEDFVNELATDIKEFTRGCSQSDDQAIIVIDIKKDCDQNSIIEQFKQKKYEVERLVTTAEKVYQTLDYDYAARLYIQAMHKEGKNDSSIMMKVAECYERLNDTENAVKYLEFAVSLEPKNFELRKYFYSLCDKLRKEINS